MNKNEQDEKIREAGSDHPRRRGRQPVDPAEKKVQITFTLTPALLERVNAKALEHSMSRTAFINLALDNACRCGIAPLSRDDLIAFLKEINK